MRYKEIMTLYEVNMSPGNLTRVSNEVEALVGIEFEMAVPTGGDDDGPEPDYDTDEESGNISNVIRFFNEGDSFGHTASQRLRRQLENEYENWSDEWYDSRWDNEKADFIRTWMEDNYWRATDEVRMEDAAVALGYDYENLSPEEATEVEDYARQEFDDEVSRIIDKPNDIHHGEARGAWQFGWSSPPDPEEWMNDTYPMMSDIADEFGIDWPHLTNPHNENFWRSTADDFRRVTGIPVNVTGRYHGRRNNDVYNMEADSSIDGPDGADASGEDGDSGWRGVEWVSPPKPLSEILKDLRQIKKWSTEYGCETNESTGLHINVSIPSAMRGSLDKLDFVKLVLFLGDDYILQQFGRQGNHFCASQFQKLQNKIENGYDSKKQSELMIQMRKDLNGEASRMLATATTPKYSSINVHSAGNYIEFRSPGGDWLNTPIEQLENTIRRFVVALEIAVTEGKFKKEYGKKLYKLLKPSMANQDDLNNFVQFSSGEITKSELIDNIKSRRRERNNERNTSEFDRVVELNNKIDELSRRGVSTTPMDERDAHRYLEGNPTPTNTEWAEYLDGFPGTARWNNPGEQTTAPPRDWAVAQQDYRQPIPDVPVTRNSMVRNEYIDTLVTLAGDYGHIIAPQFRQMANEFINGNPDNAQWLAYAGAMRVNVMNYRLRLSRIETLDKWIREYQDMYHRQIPENIRQSMISYVTTDPDTSLWIRRFSEFTQDWIARATDPIMLTRRQDLTSIFNLAHHRDIDVSDQIRRESEAAMTMNLEQPQWRAYLQQLKAELGLLLGDTDTGRERIAELWALYAALRRENIIMPDMMYDEAVIYAQNQDTTPSDWQRRIADIKTAMEQTGGSQSSTA